MGRCSAGGDLILQERFDKKAISERVMVRVEAILDDLSTYRESNFIGSMLQHQSMKATQYMSQWIEEKNR